MYFSHECMWMRSRRKENKLWFLGKRTNEKWSKILGLSLVISHLLVIMNLANPMMQMTGPWEILSLSIACWKCNNSVWSSLGTFWDDVHYSWGLLFLIETHQSLQRAHPLVTWYFWVSFFWQETWISGVVRGSRGVACPVCVSLWSRMSVMVFDTFKIYVASYSTRLGSLLSHFCYFSISSPRLLKFCILLWWKPPFICIMKFPTTRY